MELFKKFLIYICCVIIVILGYTLAGLIFISLPWVIVPIVVIFCLIVSCLCLAYFLYVTIMSRLE